MQATFIDKMCKSQAEPVVFSPADVAIPMAANSIAAGCYYFPETLMVGRMLARNHPRLGAPTSAT